MGQAKNRGTRDERVAQALAGPVKPKRLSARERDELVAEAVNNAMAKILLTPQTQSRQRTIVAL